MICMPGLPMASQNTPEGELVFQTDWDDFPRLFFYNTHNTYLIGLDPTYMQLYNSKLYDLWDTSFTERSGSPPSIFSTNFRPVMSSRT